MIVPSRWFVGGKGLDDFREEMLNDKHITNLVDFPNSTDCFNGVSIKGGVCYFLIESLKEGECKISTINKNNCETSHRFLKEPGCDVFIRWHKAVDVYRKVSAKKEKSFADIVSSRKPFGLDSTFCAFKTEKFNGALKIYANKTFGYVERNKITTNTKALDLYKVYISFAYGAGEDFPHQILNKPFLGEPKSCCTETYLMIGPFENKDMASNVISYISTKFFRFMVMLEKITQNATSKVYKAVPMQDFSKHWTDEELYKKYKLTKEEIEFIESMIKPMNLGGEENG